MLFYRAALPLSSQTLDYTAGVIRCHRRQIGSPWRKLSSWPAGSAGPGLPAQRRDVRRAGRRVRRRYRHRLALCERDRGVAGRPLPEAAPGTGGTPKKAGHAYVVIDGTLIPVDRVAADRPFYSGKHRRHGMNLHVISAPDGEILWVSGPLPGAVHDLTAARIWGILRAAAPPTGLIVLADKGYTRRRGASSASPTGDGASLTRRKTPTARTPSYAARANAPTHSSRPGASCANSAAAPGKPDSWPKPSTSFKPARSQDEKGSLSRRQLTAGARPGDTYSQCSR